MAKKNAAAVALGRRGGVKGGRARAARMTAEQRSESARNAVVARWARVNGTPQKAKAKQVTMIDASDDALVAALKRLKTTVDPVEIRQLADSIELIVFHKQFMDA